MPAADEQSAMGFFVRGSHFRLHDLGVEVPFSDVRQNRFVPQIPRIRFSSETLACSEGIVSYPDLSGFHRIGYDLVQEINLLSFGCSPLSCNGHAANFQVNEFCLIDDVQYAIQAGLKFYEPLLPSDRMVTIHLPYDHKAGAHDAPIADRSHSTTHVSPALSKASRSPSPIRFLAVLICWVIKSS